MKKSTIIRAWKDPRYRRTLKNAPESPAGVVELDDLELDGIHGAVEASATNTEGCTVSGYTVLSCGWVCTLTTECTCRITLEN